MYIKILYNRAAYTLYIKAYIKIKTSDDVCLLTCDICSLIRLPGNSFLDKWQYRRPY